ncbi:hypothetical protein NLG97_g8849 [Lecanicillium saksenae]|uniref:Uncharacterized protein n=1 Tax=Lecanicillium saksenae TaxID=468837 RepID=A0ACC1QHP2_9HYPO|nr:hypothetical protein NLG97_g8849 [Lecanicillium saksenae]
MAPLPPGLKKPSARDAAVSDDFIASKRDKRIMKHSSFMSRVAESGVGKKTKAKRTGRGRSKKLSTTLDSLADALPELEEGEGNIEALQGKIRHKSLKSKRGALKRKEQVVKGEMERFGVSMAQLAGTQEQQQSNSSKTTSEGQQQPQAANRWAALRGYISSTMEQNPAFAGKQ